ncbi:hypothetical protein BSL78_25113 [Apostichopus japonicus]|uniref:Endonuclease/exonuclease/phosphatase domain-containing protein n=1 Tax=Stichopus japonicus TaxID=307972 RepID=A0A2G8JQU0_STIJA|nr:hypothetical protein BSL78_25113 [Apostichopus japonicus]
MSKEKVSYWTKRRRLREAVEVHIQAVESSAGPLSVGTTCIDETSHRLKGNTALSSEPEPNTSYSILNTNSEHETLGVSDIGHGEGSHQNEFPFADYYHSQSSEEDDLDLGQKLAGWAVDYRIPHVAFNSLLTTLRQYPSNLPKDSRTLLHTNNNLCLSSHRDPKSVTNGDVLMVQDQPSLLQLFSIGCWNIRTLQTPLAAEHLELSLSNYRYDIIGLSETHNIGKQEDLGGRLIMSGGQFKRAGVGILMSPRAYRAMCNCWQLSDRLMAARYRLMQGSLLFISVYAPTANSTNDVREAFTENSMTSFICIENGQTSWQWPATGMPRLDQAKMVKAS